MMTTQQQSPDQVTPFAYPHGTSPAAVVSSSSSTSPANTDNATETNMSGGTAMSNRSATPSPPSAQRKRKQPSSPTDDAGANGSADAPDAGKPKEQQPSKKSRRELPPHTVAILKGWMLSREHVKHPYPTDEDKQMLLKKTGISMKQLTNWFTNARKRIWKPMMRREHSRQMQSAMEFDHTAVREFPGAGLSQQYAESSYAPRAAVRHSFDAGSLGAPPHGAAAAFDRYARPQAIPVNAPLYPSRAVRSMSEAPARTDVDEYLDAERIRERVLERGQDGNAPRNSLSPRGHKILQEWVNANARREYPYPNDNERMQLAKDTSLDVSQVDGWVTSLREQMTPIRALSIPSAGNPAFPPPPAYGERRSIPSSGNPMFPPRPTGPGSMRPSIPSTGSPQFPPPPARRDANDSRFAAFPPTANYPGHEMTRMRSMTISASPYLHPPPTASSAGMDAQAQQSAASALPSLSSRSLLSRPAPIVTSNGPTMGQPRDSRSRTLDMGQFAEARRRKMNFQDILASTGGPTNSAAPAVPTSGTVLQTPSHPSAIGGSMENVYPNDSAPVVTGYPPPASNGFQQKQPTASFEQQSGRVVLL
ncbi:Homeobox KN domain [Phytophthora infestans]|uniref:Homeobox KN domain n=1 Tax=Phytophthora infestans TaxID=4787 RepID=A0A8S9UAZ3_PHYIN|nr:Homeobox KN domain [Phytophthora infestans]